MIVIRRRLVAPVAVAVAAGFLSACGGSGNTTATMTSVSYTHLDVYKRQASSRMCRL